MTSPEERATPDTILQDDTTHGYGGPDTREMHSSTLPTSMSSHALHSDTRTDPDRATPRRPDWDTWRSVDTRRIRLGGLFSFLRISHRGSRPRAETAPWEYDKRVSQTGASFDNQTLWTLGDVCDQAWSEYIRPQIRGIIQNTPGRSYGFSPAVTLQSFLIGTDRGNLHPIVIISASLESYAAELRKVVKHSGVCDMGGFEFDVQVLEPGMDLKSDPASSRRMMRSTMRAMSDPETGWGEERRRRVSPSRIQIR